MTDHAPGSPAAVALGCTCPVLDNHHGAGFPYGMATAHYISADCPLHGDHSPDTRAGERAGMRTPFGESLSAVRGHSPGVGNMVTRKPMRAAAHKPMEFLTDYATCPWGLHRQENSYFPRGWGRREEAQMLAFWGCIDAPYIERRHSWNRPAARPFSRRREYGGG